jgi:hypothetical protein
MMDGALLHVLGINRVIDRLVHSLESSINV